MPAGPDWQIEHYRALLRLQAHRLRLNPHLRRRFDSSDVVQVAMMDAHRGISNFRGTTEAELLRWLHTILGNAAVKLIREGRADKRDPALERSIHDALLDSSVKLEGWLADRGASPSELAEQREAFDRVVAAIDGLPAEYRDVVVLRDLQQLPVAEIAAQLNLTEKSVAGRLRRGRRTLREKLGDVIGDQDGSIHNPT